MLQLASRSLQTSTLEAVAIRLMCLLLRDLTQSDRTLESGMTSAHCRFARLTIGPADIRSFSISPAVPPEVSCVMRS